MIRNLKMLVLICLAIAVMSAFAQEKPALEGGKVLAVEPCNFPPHEGVCVMVKKNNKFYIAIHDQKGQLAIYEIKESSYGKDHLMPEDVTFLWGRNAL